MFSRMSAATPNHQGTARRAIQNPRKQAVLAIIRRAMRVVSMIVSSARGEFRYRVVQSDNRQFDTILPEHVLQRPQAEQSRRILQVVRGLVLAGQEERAFRKQDDGDASEVLALLEQVNDLRLVHLMRKENQLRLRRDHACILV